MADETPGAAGAASPGGAEAALAVADPEPPRELPATLAPQRPQPADANAGAVRPATSPAPGPAAADLEDARLLRARDLALAGDTAGAETVYLELLREGTRRSVAAIRLAELYQRRGDYARAGEMYRESSRLLRESLPQPAPGAPAPSAP